jgi:hypothetical protein
MLKVVKRPPPPPSPLATVVALRSPRTKGKMKEKKCYRSIRLLKLGTMEPIEANNSMNLEGHLIEPAGPAESLKPIRRMFSVNPYISICKAGSGILPYGLFWGMIYGITVSFLKRTLNASSDNTMLAYYLTWIMEPIASLVCGCLFTIWMSSAEEISVKRTRLFWATLLSAALLVGSSMIFFAWIPRLGEDESSEAGITLSTIFTVICFAVMMISINGYMSAMNLITQPEAANAEYYGLTSGLNAVGQIIATGIIIYFGLNNNNNNNSVDNNVAPAISGVGFVFISISIIISLTFGQYWPCCQCCIYDEWCICSQHWLYWLYWEPDDEQSYNHGRDVEYVANEVSVWLVFLFVIACWIALFAFLPWSVDWYASTYYSDEYNRGVWIASWARLYQQLVMGGCSFFMLFISKSSFKHKHQSNRRRQEKLKFRAIWIFTLIGLTVYSACLSVAALTDSPDLAYIAFVVSGIGMAAIFPLNSFQTYHIFSLNAKKHEHTTAIIDNYSDNDTKTVAASPPFVCTDYYDNRQKINAAAMIGQIIILSVTYFRFHFNYKWVLVTGGVAAGTAIFLGMLLIVATPYNFENVTIKDSVSSVDDSDSDLTGLTTDKFESSSDSG